MNDGQHTAQRILDAYTADPTTEKSAEVAQFIRTGPEPIAVAVVHGLLDTLSEQREKLEAVMAPPLRTGVVWQPQFYRQNGGPACALVKLLPGGADALCSTLPGLQLESGDYVVLTESQGAVIGRLGRYQGFEIGRLERVKADSQELVVTGVNREEIVVGASTALLSDPDLKPGCKVRYSRQASMATCLEETADDPSAALVEEIPDLTWDQLGGLGEVREQLIDAEELFTASAADLDSYGLRKRLLIVFTGKPGTGKTYAAKILCADLRRRLGSDKVKFVLIRAAQLLDPLVGKTEANIRERFEYVRAMASKGFYVIMVWDEIDALFHTRGGSRGSTIVDHTLTPTLLAELDGMAPLGNFMMIAITNRPDLLDSAALREGRLGRTVYFRGPNWPEVEEIFRIHLDGRRPAKRFTRDQLAERAAAHVFTPQGNGATEVAVVRLRDGRRETIDAADLVTGALIEQVCEDSAHQAWLRGRRGGIEGITPQDLHRALDESFADYPLRLKPWNLTDYLEWPLDKVREVVDVEPARNGAVKAEHLFVASG